MSRAPSTAATTPETLASIEALRAELAGPLPGREAQLRMAPRPRAAVRFQEEPGPDVREGAVLALLYPFNGDGGPVGLPLILRPTYGGVHSGQVGFPGGGRESTDADLTETALREAYEEVGVDPARVTVLGRLSPLFVIASNYLVQPTVAWSPDRPDFHLDPYEVAALLETPLSLLMDPATVHRETWDLRGFAVDVPYFSVQGETVWGATAMMLSELIALPSIQALASRRTL